MSPPDISIVIPVLDEAGSLGRLADEIRAALADGPSFEVVLVDDGSTDGSLEVLGSLVADDPRFRAFRLAVHQGQSGALLAGLRRARAEVVVTMDADLQNDPGDIPLLLQRLDDAGVVSGVRARRNDPWLRRASSRIANRVRSRILGDGISDIGCSLKAYEARYLRNLPPFDGLHRFLPVLAQTQGARVTEVEVGHRPRVHGSSSYGIGNRLWRGILDLYGVWWLKRRWIDVESARGLVEQRCRDPISRSSAPTAEAIGEPADEARPASPGHDPAVDSQ